MKNTKKILIVDDEENIRLLFKKALEKKNYTVHTAQNAEDALQKIKKHKKTSNNVKRRQKTKKNVKKCQQVSKNYYQKT